MHIHLAELVDIADEVRVSQPVANSSTLPEQMPLNRLRSPIIMNVCIHST